MGAGHFLRKAVRHPSLSILVIIFIWIDKEHLIHWAKIIWIFNITFSGNVDLTGKQHSRHQWFWRFPLSPMEAKLSSRLPRSRDHLFSHSMSKASLPHGPDMWYLTFYEKSTHIPNHNLQIPLIQNTPNHNLQIPLIQNLTLATYVRNCGARPHILHNPRNVLVILTHVRCIYTEQKVKLEWL